MQNYAPKSKSLNNIATQLCDLATQALNNELSLYPKAGLVSFIDNGSHKDMNHITFRNSIDILQDYWLEIARLGVLGVDFSQLRQAGINAEIKMSHATNNINTHRGSIFILGILVAGVAYAKQHQLAFVDIPQIIIKLWGDDLIKHQLNKFSHGSVVRQKYATQSNIVMQASKGFPDVWQRYYPFLVKSLQQYGELAYLQLFYEILSTTEDTNLLYRGGINGLKWAKQQASIFLAGGGVEHENYFSHGEQIHHKFIKRNLSPGGCADLFSATIFLHNVRQLLWG